MARVLVIEDEPDILEILSYNLRQAGFEVEAATEGEEGLRQAEKTPPDLVVLDLMLPGMDGLELCRLLKQHETLRRVPVLMLTAKAEEVDRIVGLELGADDYVAKPFSPASWCCASRPSSAGGPAVPRSRGRRIASRSAPWPSTLAPTRWRWRDARWS